MKRIIPAITLIVVLAVALTALADNPKIMTYQAVLTNNGSAVTSPVEVTFRIYDDSIGGTVLWSDTRMVTPDASGRINELLGQNSALDEAVFAGSERYLGIQVTGDTEMSPRQPMTSAPYSFRVGTVDGAKGGTVTGDLTLSPDPAASRHFAATTTFLTIENSSGAQTILSSDSIKMVTSGADEQVVFQTDNSQGGLLSLRLNGTKLAQHSPSETRWDLSGATKDATGLAAITLFETTVDDITGDVTSRVGLFDEVTTANHDAAAVEIPFSVTLNNTGPVLEMREQGVVASSRAPGTAVVGLFGPGGMEFLDDAGNTIARIDNEGRMSSVSLNVGPPTAAMAKNTKRACGDGNTSDLGPVSSFNNAVGPDNDLSSATNSFSVGSCNNISSDASVAFGTGNTLTIENTFALGQDNVVGSGRSVSFGNSNTVFGGSSNLAVGSDQFLEGAGDCSITGGSADSIRFANNSVIGGGRFNLIVDSSNVGVDAAFNATISGGFRNTIRLTDDPSVNAGNATIGGGRLNTITRVFGTIAGGSGSTVSAAFGTVAGGNGHQVLGEGGFIGGGDQHIADGIGAVVVGGGTPSTFADNNRALADYSSIGGGRKNRATGTHSVVPGGLLNESNGDYSLAAGRRAKANHGGVFIWADSNDVDFASTAPNQFLIRADGNVGVNTNSPSEPLEVSGMIYSSSGGFRFPDGTVQSSAAASVADGWTDDGGTVRLTTSSDNVGIGTSSPAEKLDVDGNIHASGTIMSGSSIHIDGNAGEIRSSTGGLKLIPTIPEVGAFNVDVGGIGADGQFSVKDSSGNTSVAMSTSASTWFNSSGGKIGEVSLGPPGTVFFDDSGNKGWEFDQNAGTFAHYNSSGIKISETSLGPPGTVFYDGSETKRVEIAQGAANIELYDASGSQTMRIDSHRGKIALIDPSSATELMSIDAEGIVYDSTGTNDFEVTADGGVTMYSDANKTSGVQLAPGGGTWSSLSDRDSKENFHPVDPQEILNKLAHIDISSWNYKTQDEHIRHLGPVAQDFYAAFGLGHDNKHIGSVDADGVALTAIKALHQKQNELDARTTEIDDLRQQMAEMKSLIEQLMDERQ